VNKIIPILLIAAALAGCSSSVSSPTATPYQIYDITDTVQDINCYNESTDTHLIQYEVTGTAEDIEYIQCDNESYARIYDRDVTLPWSYSFCAPSEKYLWIQVHTYSANVSITAKIIVDGTILKMEEAYFEEPHAFVNIDGWVP
jgi:hypothetical protein